MYSVLIPAYNHRAFLMECVLSAVRSPLVSEILLVDDGSIDRTSDLFPLISAMDARIRILRDGPSVNRGAPARLNELVEAAQEEWVSILNSDDLFAAGRFDAIARTVMRGGVDLLFGDLVIVDGNGGRKGLRNALQHNEIPWPIGWDTHAMADRGQWLTLLGIQNIVATTTNMVFSKQIFRKVGGFRNYRYCHDWDFVIRCAIEGKIRYAPLMLSLYRSHATNTIKEGRSTVEREVRQMFRNLSLDYPELTRDRSFSDALQFNPYNTGRSAHPPLAIVMSPSSSMELVRTTAEDERLDVEFVPHGGEVPPGAGYVYAPADPSLLSPNELRNLLLAISVRPYDAFLISRTIEPYPMVGGASLTDLAVWRADADGHWAEGNVRIFRSYMADVDPRPVEDVVDLSNAAIDSALREPSVRTDWKPAIEVAYTPLGISGNELPVVFVLPAFLALGGVERIIIDTMALLRTKYRFVIVCSEPLRPEQGSLQRDAAALAPVYDLAEIVRVEDRLKAFRLLNEWYSPTLVWICNGSLWQIENSAAIREIFSGAAIVDNQAYDHQQGWIQCFNQPGVRAADRFVAVNQRIRQTMVSRYAIPADQIDLVYHGFDPCRMQRHVSPDPNHLELKARYGLQPALPVFGMVGRLTEQKRPADLVRLAERLQGINYPAQLVWVGSGELERDFVGLIDELGLRNIKLIPAQQDVQPVFAMISGLIITSAYEGLPVVMLEALSLGVPVLSTDVGAIAEVLERYGSGMIFGPVGDIDALEQAFCTFVDAIETFRRCAVQNARVTMEDFSSARMAREYDHCFQTAIARFREPGRKDVSGGRALDSEVVVYQ